MINETLHQALGRMEENKKKWWFQFVLLGGLPDISSGDLLAEADMALYSAVGEWMHTVVETYKLYGGNNKISPSEKRDDQSNTGLDEAKSVDKETAEKLPASYHDVNATNNKME